MKILLTAINSKYIHSNLAVRLLKAYAEKKAAGGNESSLPEIAISEYTINNFSEDVLSDIFLQKPDVIMFSCYIWNWAMIKKLIRDIPKVLPGTDIWLGGPEVTYDADKVLEELPQVRGVFVGEGEQTFAELAAAYGSLKKSVVDCENAAGIIPVQKGSAEFETALRNIAGLCLRSGFTPPREPMDMAEIPFVYDSEAMGDLAHKIIYYESSRGCPYRCSYCLSSIDKKVRFRPVEMVKKELQFFIDAKVPQVKFVDRTFNCSPKRSIEIWNYVNEHDNGVTNFHFEVEGGILTDEEIETIAGMRPGLIQLEVGVQSTKPETLTEIRRSADLGKIKENVRRVREKRNVHQHLDLIAGLPFEDMESFRKSFNEVYAMEPDQLQLGFLKVLKGSYMYEKAADYGVKYSEEAPYEVLSTSWLSYDDILKLKRVEEMVELYYNSGQFKAVIPELIKHFDDPFGLFESLAEHYAKMGYFTNSPARSYRYNVLLDFAVRSDPENEALYRELLTYDLYLREKCKSRPDFARDLKPFEQELRQTCKDKKQHADVFFYPVWENVNENVEVNAEKAENAGGASEEKEYYIVCFDYENRDPLDHNAAVTVFRGQGINR